VQTGSGSSRLDEAALEAVKKWQFVPAKRGEQSVSASVVVPVRFSIEEG
jgi:outer membrane transport energization protein TonB (TC 2.C.1.1.1)